MATDLDDHSDSEEHLSYTTAVEVTAGAHIVRQDAGTITGSDLLDESFAYNACNLTVIFVPTGSVTAAASATTGN